MRGAVLVLVAGCAQGGREVTIDAADVVDAKVYRDARDVDAPPGAVTKELVQTTSTTMQPGTSIACNVNPPGTNASNYYRVFDLGALGINSAFKVTQVSFQVEDCERVLGTGGINVAVRVGTYAGTPDDQLDPAMMTILTSNPTVAVPEVVEDPGPPPTSPGATVMAPMSATIPAGGKLLVEVDVPDGHNQYYFYMGANQGGESAPGYILAPACHDGSGTAITKPTNISKVSATFPTINLLMTVTGQYLP